MESKQIHLPAVITRPSKYMYVTDEEHLIESKDRSLTYSRVIQGDNLDFLDDYHASNKGAGVLIIDPPRMKHLGGTLAEQVEYLQKRVTLSWEILAEGGYLIVLVDIEESHHIRNILDEVLTGVYTLNMHVIRKLDGYDKVIYIQKGVEVKNERDQEAVFVKGGKVVHMAQILQSQQAPFIPVTLTRSIVEYYKDYQPGIFEATRGYDLYYLEAFILPDEVAQSLPEGEVKHYNNGTSKRLILKQNRLVYQLKDKPKQPEDLKLDLMYGEFFEQGKYQYVEGVKPLALIKNILRYTGVQSHYVIDIFAGTGTTAQALMELNAEDGGKRVCILVEKEDPLTIIYPRLKHVEAQGIAQNCIFQRIHKRPDEGNPVIVG